MTLDPQAAYDTNMRSNRLHCAVFSYVTGHSNLALRTRIGMKLLSLK